MLDLGHAVHGVVIGLAHHRAVDAKPVADGADFRNAPAFVVRHAEMADLAGADEVAHCVHGLGERRVQVFLVQIVNVDVVGAEPAQARVDCAHGPLTREAARVRSLPHGIGEFRGEHPLVALVRDGAAGHLLGTAAIVGVGSVDEIDACLALRCAVGSSVAPPNIMVPRQRGDTFSPLRPRLR